MCTRILWNDNPIATVAARSLDWAVDDEPDLWFLPRGLTRRGGPEETALEWTSRYASLAVSMWRLGAIDGVNEKGLVAHALYLDGAGYEAEDDRPTVANRMWAQWVIDNFASVAEVVEHLHDVRISSPDMRGQQMGAHLAVEDATGDSAIIEPIDGRLVVHHGPEYRVMANAPHLSAHLENLRQYEPFGGTRTPPGDISSADRFVRANYFLHYLPEPEDYTEAVAGVLGLIRNVAVPYGAPYANNGGVYPTWWESVTDATNRTYYFSSTRSPSIFWVRLDELVDGDAVLQLDPRDPALVGDVTGLLEPAALPF